MAAPLVIVSNRGPVAYVREEDGSVTEKRGVGGLVTALTAALQTRDALWVASAITDEDHRRAGETIEVPIGERPVGVRMVSLDAEVYDGYYNGFSNRVIWFLHHGLWEEGTPSFGDEERAWWAAYVEANERIAAAVADAAPNGAIAFVNDYQLALVPALLRRDRPDLATAFFWHIPFCEPQRYRELPEEWGRPLLEGMLAADRTGFHTGRWANAFTACAREIASAEPAGTVGVNPIGVDVDGLTAEATGQAVRAAREEIAALVAGRRLVLRSDRTEPSKNILRGLLAFERVLQDRPELREHVVNLIMLTPSRRLIPEYRRYLDACVEAAERINLRFGPPHPVILEIEDDFPRTLAGYLDYDVLLVNPVFDGLNLVAREGPTLNERDGVLVLSQNAGAAASLGDGPLLVDPYDVEATAEAIARALDMDADERAERAEGLRAMAAGTRPERWLEDQIEPLER